MKKVLSMLLIVMIISSLLVGCGSNVATEEGTKEEPKEELKLTIYAGLMEDHAMLAAREFEKATGVKTEFVRMSGGEILARIRAEKENQTASVWYGGGALTFISGNEEGLLEHYISPGAKNIPDKFKDPNGAWTGIYSGYLGIEGDKKWLEENGYELPKTWDDLLKPEFEGNIVVAHPGSSSTAYNFLATILQLKGEEEGFKYLQKFNKQVRQYTKSGSAPGRMIGLGEAPIALGFLHDAIKFKEEGYENIIFTVAEEGTGYEIGAVGIIKGGPDQKAAKMFVDWCLTKEAQELGKTIGSYQFLTNPEANPPEQAMQLKGTKLIDYDFVWAGEHRSEFIEKFNELTKTTPPKK